MIHARSTLRHSWLIHWHPAPYYPDADLPVSPRCPRTPFTCSRHHRPFVFDMTVTHLFFSCLFRSPFVWEVWDGQDFARQKETTSLPSRGSRSPFPPIQSVYLRWLVTLWANHMYTHTSFLMVLAVTTRVHSFAPVSGRTRRPSASLTDLE